MSELVLAAQEFPSNAELIEACFTLGYLRDDDRVLDPTYGNGVWWKNRRPADLVAHVRKRDGTDFRDLPHPDRSFDAVAFDPPYVAPGGRKTSTVKEMHDRYGMAEGGYADPDFSNPQELQAIIDAGLAECWRVVKRRGIVLVKCKDYVWSGSLYEGATATRNYAVALGFDVVDRFEHVGDPGPQPKGRTRKCRNCGGGGRDPSPLCPECHGEGRVPSTQQHASRNLSTLFVLRRPRRDPERDPETLFG